jgi:hypothetical protein
VYPDPGHLQRVRELEEPPDLAEPRHVVLAVAEAARRRRTQRDVRPRPPRQRRHGRRGPPDGPVRKAAAARGVLCLNATDDGASSRVTLFPAPGRSRCGVGVSGGGGDLHGRAAERAVDVGAEPGVDAGAVEGVGAARQQAQRLAVAELREAHRAAAAAVGAGAGAALLGVVHDRGDRRDGALVEALGAYVPHVVHAAAGGLLVLPLAGLLRHRASQNLAPSRLGVVGQRRALRPPPPRDQAVDEQREQEDRGHGEERRRERDERGREPARAEAHGGPRGRRRRRLALGQVGARAGAAVAAEEERRGRGDAAAGVPVPLRQRPNRPGPLGGLGLRRLRLWLSPRQRLLLLLLLRQRQRRRHGTDRLDACPAVPCETRRGVCVVVVALLDSASPCVVVVRCECGGDAVEG